MHEGSSQRGADARSRLTLARSAAPVSVGVVSLLPGRGRDETVAHTTAVDVAMARLREVVRPDDRLQLRDGRLVIDLHGVGSATGARRVAQRMWEAVSQALQGLGPVGVVVAVAWGRSTDPKETLEARAVAAVATGTIGPGVVLNRGPAADRAGDSQRLVAPSVAPGSWSTVADAAAAPTPFVGRAPVLEQLREAWAEAAGGTSRLVGVAGEAGIGKTSLLRAFGAEFDPSGVLWVAGEAEEQHLPFGLLGRLTARAPARLVAALSDWDSGLTPRSDPLMAGAGLLGALTTTRAPLLVVIDDGHDVDRESLVALGFLARRLYRDPILLVMAYRSEESRRLGSGWQKLLAQPSTLGIRLEGLTPPELTALSLAEHVGPLSPVGAGRLYEHTRGHPLYARLLLEQLPLDSFERTEVLLPAPASLAGVIVARLGSCHDATRRFVATAAVLGMRSDTTLVEAVSGVVATEATMREATAAGLLVSEIGPDGPRVSFTHPLVRAAVYHDIDAVERRRLHRRAGQSLGAGAGLAHRVEAAAGPDATLAGEVERAATDEAASGHPYQAAVGRWKAFELTPPGVQRGERLLSAIEARLVVGDLDIGAGPLAEMSRLAPDAWVDYVEGFLSMRRGRLGEAAGHLARAWGALDTGGCPPRAPDDLRGRVATISAAVATLRLDGDEMLRWGEEATGGPSPRWSMSMAWIARLLGSALAQDGDPEVAQAMLARLARTDDLDLAAAGGMLHLFANDPRRAHYELLAVLERAFQGGVLLHPTLAFGALGAAAFRFGRIDEALIYGDLAVDIADEADRGSALVIAHAWAAHSRAARGDLDRARIHATAAEEWATRQGMAEPRSVPAAAHAAIADVEGDDEAYFEAARRLDAAHLSPRCNTHGFGPVLADALMRLGRSREAGTTLDAYEQAHAGRGSRPYADMASARIRGRLAAARGDWDGAAVLFDQALGLAGSLEMPLEVARCHVYAGQGALDASRPQPAAYHLFSARRAFDSLGADGYATRTTAIIDDAGLAERDRDHVLSGLLTPAEGAVARLVSTGLTNKEVAARLFISAKTVAYHLTNIYAKLGATSRQALVDQLGPDGANPVGGARLS